MRSTPRVRYVAALVIIFGFALSMRGLWLIADPPNTSVGIVWHDEGPWTHNARNAALWGVWRTDAWNPVFVAPVFTALEYAAFKTFGVGTWQARTVPVASGILALAFLIAGLWVLYGPAPGIVGGLLLATDFTWVMWNRAALMESTMTAFIVVAWAAYALAARRPVWGFVAGLAAILAVFTKASAAFFVAAIAIDALVTIGVSRMTALRARLAVTPPSAEDVRGAWNTLAGLTIAGGVIGLVFVLPHWADYQFYNWQMSVQRKPSYDLASFRTRASWLPLVQDFFTRMWVLFAAAAVAILGVVARWRHARPAERLLVLWMALGLLQLVVHDAGNERRYVMFIPAIIALGSALLAARTPWLPAGLERAHSAARMLAIPILLVLGYLVFGSALRPFFAEQLRPDVGEFKTPVRMAAALAGIATVVALIFWTRLTGWLANARLPYRATIAVVGLCVVWNMIQYQRWAGQRTDLNYRASIALGELLPAGTLVHGKLANGLSLENHIRPVFVGNGFGNYDDRLSRDDVRYILTYELPRVGYESQKGLMAEILAHYPGRRRIAEFTVDETPGPDLAILVLKQPGSPPTLTLVSGMNRARD